MARVLSPYAMGSESIRRQKAYTKDDFLKSRLVFKVIFLVAFTAILCLFYIWSRVQIVHYGYEINQLTHQQSELIEEGKKLQLELATLKSPQRLEKIAREKLSMQPPLDAQVKSIGL